jgi:c-di-GMP-binding flagellar brake protein YcgR
MEQDNRRKHPRINYPCQLTMWTAEGEDTVLAQAADIGLGGLCVELNGAIAIGMKVAIEIDFNDSTASFRCKGVVVRCRQDSSSVYNIGIQFEPLSTAQHAFLDGKITEIIHLEKKGH